MKSNGRLYLHHDDGALVDRTHRVTELAQEGYTVVRDHGIVEAAALLDAGATLAVLRGSVLRGGTVATGKTIDRALHSMRSSLELSIVEHTHHISELAHEGSTVIQREGILEGLRCLDVNATMAVSQGFVWNGGQVVSGYSVANALRDGERRTQMGKPSGQRSTIKTGGREEEKATEKEEKEAETKKETDDVISTDSKKGSPGKKEESTTNSDSDGKSPPATKSRSAVCCVVS